MYDFHSPKQKTAIGSQETEPRPSNIIQIDQNLLETRLDRLVAEKVAELLNAMLDAEADEIANAAKYERTGERKAYRAGHYDRSLTAKAGRLALKVPKLKGAVFGHYLLASLVYIIALAFYKHWLHSQYDVMNGSLIERAFATAGKPWYWFFLLTGFAFIILLVCMGVHLFRKDKSVLGNLVGLILNIVLIVILVTVF